MMYPANDYRSYLEHSAKGQKWKKHKYLYITSSGRYVYPSDERGKSTVHNTTVYGWNKDDKGNRSGINSWEDFTFGGSGRSLGKVYSVDNAKKAVKNAALDKALNSTFGKTRGNKLSINVSHETLDKDRSDKINSRNVKVLKKFVFGGPVGKAITRRSESKRAKERAPYASSAQYHLNELLGTDRKVNRRKKKSNVKRSR